MAKKQPEYTYKRHSSMWAVVRWQDTGSGRYHGTVIETYDLREVARKRVYELNGWQYK